MRWVKKNLIKKKADDKTVIERGRRKDNFKGKYHLKYLAYSLILTFNF